MAAGSDGEFVVMPYKGVTTNPPSSLEAGHLDAFEKVASQEKEDGDQRQRGQRGVGYPAILQTT